MPNGNGNRNGNGNGKKPFANLVKGKGGNGSFYRELDLKPPPVIARERDASEEIDNNGNGHKSIVPRNNWRDNRPVIKKKIDPDMLRFGANAAALSRIKSEFQINSLALIVLEVGNDPTKIRNYLIDQKAIGKK